MDGQRGITGVAPGQAGGDVARRTAVHVDAVLDALPAPTLLLDPDGTVLLVNSAWQKAAAELRDDRFRFGVGDDYFALALQVRDDDSTRALIEHVRAMSRGEQDSASVDFPLPLPDGTRWYHVQASRVDEAGHIVVSHVDITSRVRAERASAWQARHDPLTGLPNRARLHELIDAELRRADQPAVAVLFLDVDGFKDVNDSLGHEVGDDLLRQLAIRLSSTIRAQDVVGRLGGDEFVILCRETGPDAAEVLAGRCQTALAEPFRLAGRRMRLGASIGIAGLGTGERTCSRSTDLVRDADLAMYAAKAAGRNRVRIFSSDLRSAVQQKVLVAGELREAIDAGQLVLHYQPVLRLPNGDVEGAEALVRWQHPERGLLLPGDFLSVAEEYELMDALTRWVLHEATRQAAQWQRAGLPLLIGVNVSASTLAGGTLMDDVAEALTVSGAAPELLVVELTETTVAEDPERAAAQFAALRVSGVEVVIDDFGSGFSSLGQLVNIPAGGLKIDRSLVNAAAGRQNESAAAIAAVVALGRACGMRTLAEGVETAEQLALATELGCSLAQGFHIARPMPAAELAEWAAHRMRRPATSSA
jgi:diguanylate cyclase (GGDEF)-like protein